MSPRYHHALRLVQVPSFSLCLQAIYHHTKVVAHKGSLRPVHLRHSDSLVLLGGVLATPVLLFSGRMSLRIHRSCTVAYTPTLRIPFTPQLMMPGLLLLVPWIILHLGAT